MDNTLFRLSELSANQRANYMEYLAVICAHLHDPEREPLDDMYWVEDVGSSSHPFVIRRDTLVDEFVMTPYFPGIACDWEGSGDYE